MSLWHGHRHGQPPTRGVALLALLALVYPPPASARATGIVVTSCSGCHGSGAEPPELSLSADPAKFNPGDSVTLTLTIKSSSIRVGGAFITTGGVGTLQALPGEGLATNQQGLTHTAPKAAQNGVVTFHFGWQAPAKPGGVDFGVAALAGNGNNATSGDAPGSGEFQWAFGCEASTFYVDLDRDGYGSKQLGTLVGCVGDTPPTGYATQDGDCDENSEKVHPGAIEVCNKHDDDCNGQIDENAPPVTMWPDGDGDGYYRLQSGTSQLGCGNVPGYAASSGDCDDTDRAINPGATEICNNKDDNCDGQIDERVRPSCGVGWCSRYSPTCDAADCRPGAPRAETCNQFDDDCDGEDDNGACPSGMLCSVNQCVSSGGGSASTETPRPSSGAGAAAAGSSTSMSASGAPSSGAPPSEAHAAPESGCALHAGQTSRWGDYWIGVALAAWLGRGARRRAKRRAHSPGW